MNPLINYLNQAAQINAVQDLLRVLGIDLGTTNSTAAEIIWSPGRAGPPEVRCLAIDQATEEGRYTHALLPSIIARLEDRILVGEGAKRLRASSSERGLERGRDLFWDCKNDPHPPSRCVPQPAVVCRAGLACQKTNTPR